MEHVVRDVASTAGVKESVPPWWLDSLRERHVPRLTERPSRKKNREQLRSDLELRVNYSRPVLMADAHRRGI